MKKIAMFCIICFLGVAFMTSSAYALKIGSVDLRRAFYEYEKSKTFDQELTDVTSQRTEERNKKVEEIRKIRDEAELLSEDAKAAKQQELDSQISALNDFDRDTRQELLNKKNDMFKEVISDIQAVVEDIGQKEKYDYIFDARNIMFSKEGFDVTDEVLKRLNK